MANFIIPQLQSADDYNNNEGGLNYSLQLTTEANYTTTNGTRTIIGSADFGNYNYPVLGLRGDVRQYTDDDRPAKGILFPR
tara:strand:- start:120 stop:362 length:243 start_codon:yes stop_codon:yes gene_type:complete